MTPISRRSVFIFRGSTVAEGSFADSKNLVRAAREVGKVIFYTIREKIIQVHNQRKIVFARERFLNIRLQIISTKCSTLVFLPKGTADHGA